MHRAGRILRRAGGNPAGEPALSLADGQRLIRRRSSLRAHFRGRLPAPKPNLTYLIRPLDYVTHRRGEAH
jgi:hypothetical protein